MKILFQQCRIIIFTLQILFGTQLFGQSGTSSFFTKNGKNDIEKKKRLSLDTWSLIHVDSTRSKWGDFADPPWLKYYGLAMEDVTGDGYKDIVSGRYFYRNPGGDMTSKWTRTDLELNADGMLFADVDGDGYGDIIAEASPNVYWLEAEDKQGNSWKAIKIAQIPATGHSNGQGSRLPK